MQLKKMIHFKINHAPAMRSWRAETKIKKSSTKTSFASTSSRGLNLELLIYQSKRLCASIELRNKIQKEDVLFTKS